jgi:hypothetical protein
MGNFVGHCLGEIFLEIAGEKRAVETQLQALLSEAELAGRTTAQVETDIGLAQVATECTVRFFDAVADLRKDLLFLSLIEFCGHL